MPIAAALEDLESLRERARRIRIQLVRNSHHTQTPHLGSCLSCVDILVAAYFHLLRLDIHQPQAPDRDRFVLSKGHAAPTLFHVLAERGIFPRELLEHYGEDGQLLAEHPPTPDHLPGIEAATGSLGHGLPIAVGIALASKIQKIPYRVLALVGDGECNEGSIWEAALQGAGLGLENLTVIVDYNGWQATGRSDEVLSLAPLAAKWAAFGWETVEIDGHDMETLVQSLSRPAIDKPHAIIAHTIKGKGVSFMQDDNNWHYRIPNPDELARALQELEASA